MNHYLVLSIYIVGRLIGTVTLQAALFLCFQIKQDQNRLAMQASFRLAVLQILCLDF